jgi:hypothetical protein
MKQTVARPFTHVCKKCGHLWFSAMEEPCKCSRCESRNWNNANDVYETHIPIPVFDHSEDKQLPFIGARCPYCRGTTGTDSVERVQFCYSCDAIWNLRGQFVGVKVGIGVR